MKSRLKISSEYSQNVLTLMTGTTLSQAIPIAITPILTRIYTPEDFGVYAMFVAIITILGTIASGRYELAILLPEKDEDAINIFALGLLITMLMVMITAILVIVFKDNILSLLNNQEMKYWLYFVPVAVCFIGCHNLLLYINNRFKDFKGLSSSFIIRSSTSALLQISIASIKKGVTGLISGQIISQLISDIWLVIIMSQHKINLSVINKTKVIDMAKRYSDFPKFSVPAVLANKLTSHLSNIIVATIFSLSTLGFYSHVQRVLGLPSSLMGASISRVFFHEANNEKQNTGMAIKTFKKTILKLLFIGIPIFGLLYFIVEDLFAFMFGETWRIAGEYAKIVIPLFFVKFVVSSVSSIDTIMEKQKLDLLFNIVLLFISLIVIVVSSNYSFNKFLINWTISMSSLYACYGYLLMKMSQAKI